MKIGIVSSAYIDKYGLEKGAKKMKEHGYFGVDWQGFINTETEFFNLEENEFKGQLENIRYEIEKVGLKVTQAHAPWRYPPKESTEEERFVRIEQMKKAVRGTYYLDCDKFVVHPLMPFGTEMKDYADQMQEINYAFLKELCTYAKGYGVTVCLENMPFLELSISSVDSIVEFVKKCDFDNLKICLDVGHALVWGEQPSKSLEKIGDLLGALHIHDNDGKGDYHWLPKTGVCDWESFIKKLKKSAYRGVFSLETTIKQIGDEMEVEQAEKELIETVKSLID